MRILDFLVPEAITTDLRAANKKESLEALVEMLRTAKKVKDTDAVVKVLLEREKTGTTGIGQGVAIPHGKTDQVSRITAAFGCSKAGVPFDAVDGDPVYLFFLLVYPPDETRHLTALSRLARHLKDKFFRQALREAKNAEEVLKMVEQEDTT